LNLITAQKENDALFKLLYFNLIMIYSFIQTNLYVQYNKSKKATEIRGNTFIKPMDEYFLKEERKSTKALQKCTRKTMILNSNILLNKLKSAILFTTLFSEYHPLSIDFWDPISQPLPNHLKHYIIALISNKRFLF
jgi:hypothetical protein